MDIHKQIGTNLLDSVKKSISQTERDIVLLILYNISSFKYLKMCHFFSEMLTYALSACYFLWICQE